MTVFSIRHPSHTKNAWLRLNVACCRAPTCSQKPDVCVSTIHRGGCSRIDRHSSAAACSCSLGARTLRFVPSNFHTLGFGSLARLIGKDKVWDPGRVPPHCDIMCILLHLLNASKVPTLRSENEYEGQLSQLYDDLDARLMCDPHVDCCESLRLVCDVGVVAIIP